MPASAGTISHGCVERIVARKDCMFVWGTTSNVHVMSPLVGAGGFGSGVAFLNDNRRILVEIRTMCTNQRCERLQSSSVLFYGPTHPLTINRLRRNETTSPGNPITRDVTGEEVERMVKSRIARGFSPLVRVYSSRKGESVYFRA